MKRVGLAVVGLLLWCSGLFAQRLPEQGMTPENYQLRFTPNLEKATFAGEETIRLHLDKPATAVTLNSAEITFQSVSVIAAGKTQTATVALDDKKEQATFTVPSSIPAGTVEVHANYTGILNDQLRGFYLSQTKRRRYAVTQFEATDARRAFPSFDEPAYKATYDITLTIDKDDTAISNGAIVSDTPGPDAGKHTLKFSTTPKMSTYLVAMMVGDFQCASGGADNIPIRVCSVPENRPYINYALTAAQNILQFYDRYYSIKYPFKKLDIIAFPDFAAGAMENTAAITYREEDLLINDQTASVTQKKLVVDVLSHEMAHQWFGDLVTMKWWNDIWLNEGFATWMSHKPAESWKPEWNAEMDEVQGTGDALNTDEVSTIRPIRAEAETPAEIAALFDGIAYDKTAAVLRMIESYVGSEPFRAGVNLYLGKHAYANATAEDFWSAETEATHKPIDKIMPTFVNQAGAPLVGIKTQCVKGKTEVALTQQRYFADRDKLEAGSPEKWQIPVCLKTSNSKDAKCEMFAEKSETFELDGCDSWVFANATGRGYYRVSYDPDTVKKLAGAAETSLTPEERISFLNDSWAMVAVGRESIGDYLTTLTGMKNERTRAVVELMISHLGEIRQDIASTADRAAFEVWTRQLLQPILNDVGVTARTADTDEQRQMRAVVFRALGTVGKDSAVITEARKETEAYMKDPASLDAATSRNALAVAAANGDAALYDQFVAHMKSAKTPDEFYTYLRSLAAFPQAELATRTGELFLTPEVKGQDVYQIFGIVANSDTQKAGWEFFKAHFKELRDKLGNELGAGLAQAANYFCDPQLRDDSQTFFAAQNIPGSQRDLANARERVNECIDLRNLQQSNLDTFLKANR